MAKAGRGYSGWAVGTGSCGQVSLSCTPTLARALPPPSAQLPARPAIRLFVAFSVLAVVNQQRT